MDYVWEIRVEGYHALTGTELLDLSLEPSDSGALLTGSLTQDALFDLLDRLRAQGSALVCVSRHLL
jgi:hypothetical protein